MGAKTVLVTSPVLTAPRTTAASAGATCVSLFTLDLLVLSAVYWLAVVGRHLVSPGYSLAFYLQPFPFVGLLLAGFVLQGLYPGLLLHPAEEMRRVFYSTTAVFLLIASASFFSRNAESYSRSVFLTTWAAGIPFVFLARYIARNKLSRRRWWGVPAVVFGSGPAAQRVLRTLREKNLGVRVEGIFTDGHPPFWSDDLPPVLGDLSSAPRAGSSRLGQYAIVAMPNKSSLELRRAIEECCRGFQHVLLVPDLPGLCSIGICAREIGGEVGFEVPQRLFHQSAGVLKRLIDVVFSCLILIMLTPLFALIAIAIKLTSAGPVFYGHLRHGRHGETFTAFKFRTMVRDADKVLREYLANHPEYRAEWQRDHKLKNDPRITNIGRWLRRFSLDELPQIFNVLAGHMSLVGPRPIVQAEISKYGRGYDLYTRVLPGLTGLWQISGRNNTTYEERVEFDEYYVRNWSIWMDTYILLRTVGVVLKAEGAY